MRTPTALVMLSPGNHDAIVGGLYGLLIGDAAGVPYEFKRPADLPPRGQIEFPPPTGFSRSHLHAPSGAWSDDGAQALCLLASLLHCRRLDIADFGLRLVNWLDSGYMAVGGVVFDVGGQTHAALASVRQGIVAADTPLVDERFNGNGSLMRVLPLALLHHGTDAELVRDAAAQSAVTHPHVRSQVCCALYCLWVRATLERADDPWSVATARLRAVSAGDLAWSAELETHIQPDSEPHGTGSGYVVDCLHSARWASQEVSFQAAIQRAISLGNDTDTTAAITGGIVGVRVGLSGIPKRWLASLSGQEILEPIVKALLA
jgi:ADP-ribosyl-[dinitrogen reductase] hydrolase